MLERVPPGDRVTLQGMLLPSVWYPAEVLQHLEATAADVLAGADDRDRLFRDMGRFSAALNLGPGGMQRPYVREGDPHFLLQNVPRLYGSQHSHGHRVYEWLGATSARLSHFDTEPANPDDCLTTAGWLEEAVAACGGRAPTVVERHCRASGAVSCEFAIDWR